VRIHGLHLPLLRLGHAPAPPKLLVSVRGDVYVDDVAVAPARLYWP
jgi:hypothetical protein